MNNQEMLISVIVPVYNREDTIERAVDSILNQTFSDWELILVDDGSTDRSGEICDRYASRDSRIKVFHTENRGVSHARNLGLDNARGAWIAFLDSDDEYYANALGDMYDNSTGADLIISPYIISADYSVHALKKTESVALKLQSDVSVEAYYESLFSNVWGKLFKKTLLLNKKFDEDLSHAEDSLFFLDVGAEARSIRYLPCLSYHYHTDSNNSLVKMCGLRKLDSLNKYLLKTLSVFTDKQIIDLICRYYAYSVVDWFGTVLVSDGLSDVNKRLITNIALNDYVMAAAPKIEYPPLSAFHDELWQTLISCDYESIFKKFNSKYHQLSSTPETAEVVPPEFFNINLAGINIKINHRYELIKEKSSNYIIDSPEVSDISTFAPQDRIEYSKKFKLDNDNEIVEDDFAEYDALPYRFYGELPKFNAFWLHSAVIEKDGVGYAFTAQPGTGKSTHASLWLKAFPDAHVIDGDNPIIRLNPDDGQFYAYGTPFCGKEGWNENRGVPLKAVCFLERGEANEIHRVKPEFVLARLMKDNFCIKPENGEAHYNLYRKFTEKTKFYSLRCNMDVEAAEVAYKTMANG